MTRPPRAAGFKGGARPHPLCLRKRREAAACLPGGGRGVKKVGLGGEAGFLGLGIRSLHHNAHAAQTDEGGASRFLRRGALGPGRGRETEG